MHRELPDPPEPVDPDIDLHDPGQRRESRVHPGTMYVIVLGGMIGAAARHGIELGWPPEPGRLPWATFVTNLGGSLLLGVLMVVVQETASAHPLVRPFVGVGVIGGFTTFSTYAVQSRALLAGDVPHPALALAYVFGTAVGALAAVWVGLTLARAVAHRHWRRPVPEVPASPAPTAPIGDEQ